MEQEASPALSSAQHILATLPEEEYDTLCHRSIKKRKVVVDDILGKLQLQDEQSQGDILQSLPIVMLTEGRYIEAANFIIHTIERGGYFDPYVILEVFQSIGKSMIISLEEGETEDSEVMRKILYSFTQKIISFDDYKGNPLFYISIGSIFEAEGKSENAIQAYKKAREYGSTDAYICIANILHKLSRHTESAQILNQAYTETGDQRFLQGYISALAKSGNRNEAYKLYLELLKKNTRPSLQNELINPNQDTITSATGLPPFIVFTEEVHNDSDLSDFSELLTQYHIDGTYLPNPQLRNLAENASIYISNEREKMNKTLGELGSAPIESWNEEQVLLYRELIKRRLYLMQTHIIILQDHRYLDEYLHDMYELLVRDHSGQHKILREFFIEHFNPYTQAAYDYISENQGEDTGRMDIFGALRLHLVHISALFSQGTFYEDIRDTIDPLIQLCLDQAGDGEDTSIDDSPDLFHSSGTNTTDTSIISTQSDSQEDPDMMELRKESKNYEALSASTMDMYEKYVGFLDAKYGMFYRRSIQQLVRNRAAVPPSLAGEFQASLRKYNENQKRAFMEVIHNMPILLEDPYIALFFFVEKILLGYDILEEGQTIDEWIIKYGLHTLSSGDAFLLANALYENGYIDYAIHYLITIPGILQEPQALYMIMESIRYMDEDTENDSIGIENDLRDNGEKDEIKGNILITKLNSICKMEFDIDDFFGYFQGFAENVFQDDDATDADIGYTLLASANMRCIHEQGETETIEEFITAGNYGLTYGYISAGDMMQEMDEYNKAIELFLSAHQLAPSITTIRRLITVYIRTEDFDEAWRLLNDAIGDGYDVGGYVTACYFYQGRKREALMEYCKIITSSGDIDFSFPEGFEESFDESITIELNNTIASTGDFSIRILSSYVFAAHMSTGPNSYLDHTKTILKLLMTYEIRDISDILITTIPLLTGKIALPSNLTSTEISLLYLQLHLESIHNILLDLYKTELLNNNITNEGAGDLLKLLNEFMVTAMFVVKEFPNSQKYVTTWQRGINFYPNELYQPSPSQFIHEMPVIVQ